MKVFKLMQCLLSACWQHFVSSILAPGPPSFLREAFCSSMKCFLRIILLQLITSWMVSETSSHGIIWSVQARHLSSSYFAVCANLFRTEAAFVLSFLMHYMCILSLTGSLKQTVEKCYVLKNKTWFAQSSDSMWSPLMVKPILGWVSGRLDLLLIMLHVLFEFKFPYLVMGIGGCDIKYEKVHAQAHMHIYVVL